MDEGRDLAIYGALLLGSGFASGFAGGLFGIGGGVLRIPIFLHLFPAFGIEPGVVMHLAAGTSLALGVPTGLRSVASQRAKGQLDAAFLRSWLPALLIGVLIGLFAVRFLSGSTLTALFGVAMLGVALQMLLMPGSFHLTPEVPGQPLRGGLAASIAALSTMIGVSGGAFITPALTILGMGIHRAVAIAAASSAAVAAVGALGSVVNGLGVPGRPDWSLGYVEVAAVGLMLPAILVSAPLGVRLASRLSDARLRSVFGVFLIAIALDMLRHAITGHG